MKPFAILRKFNCRGNAKHTLVSDSFIASGHYRYQRKTNRELSCKENEVADTSFHSFTFLFLFISYLPYIWFSSPPPHLPLFYAAFWNAGRISRASGSFAHLGLGSRRTVGGR